jgi:hypothetical protein
LQSSDEKTTESVKPKEDSMQLTSRPVVRLLGLAALLAANSAFAQQSEQPSAPVVEASTNCFATFAIGTITYCVSEHGNIARLTSPAAAPEHIRIGVIREGYAVCGATVAGGAPQVAYDSGNVEAGWQAAVTIVQPGGANTLPLCITRRTNSNLEVQQCFSHVANEKEIVVTMTVRNVSGATRYNVMMDRYFDGDIAGTAGNDRYTRSLDAGWADEGLHGLALRDINGVFAPAHTTAVHTFVGFNAATCNQATIATPTALGDYVGRLSYQFGNLLANASRTVRVQYDKL